MEQMFDKFFDSIANLFGGGDSIPWCDRDVIHGCEKEVAEANKGDSDEQKSESIMRLSWALVHSKQTEDVQRGIAMLEDTAGIGKTIMRAHTAMNLPTFHPIALLYNSIDASLANTSSPLHQREKLYLLAVGYYRTAEYSNSRHLVDQCLEIAPDWRQALTLKKTVEDQIAKDGLIGIGITASAVGLIAAGIVAALVRR